MKNWKKIIDDFFTKRYEYLLECSTNILRLISRTDLATTLLTEVYHYLIDNEKKIDENKLEAVAVRWMKMQVYWRNTEFKKQWIYPDKNIKPEYSKYDNLPYIEQYSFEEEEDKTEDELFKEETEIESKLKHIFLETEKKTLDKRILFDLVFFKNVNTSGKLSKHTGICRTLCYFLIKNMKDDLKQSYKDKNKKT